jgi:hypothetical protein
VLLTHVSPLHQYRRIVGDISGACGVRAGRIQSYPDGEQQGRKRQKGEYRHALDPSVYLRFSDHFEYQ